MKKWFTNNIGMGGGLMLGGFIIFLVAVLTFGVLGQGTRITPNASKNQVNTTLGTGPGKILTYTRFISTGAPTDADGESLESMLSRLFAMVGSNASVRFEYSADTTSWHTGYQAGTDRYIRLVIGSGTPSAAIDLRGGASSQLPPAAIVSALESLSGLNRLPATAVRGLPAQLTGLQIVALLEALTPADQLSYTKLSDKLTGADIVTMLTDLQTGKLPFSALDSSSIAVQWAYLQNVPDYAKRWPTLTEIPGLEERIRELFQTWGLSIPEAPHWHRIAHQELRRGSAYSLDLNEQVLGTATFTIADAPNDLPSGLSLANGIISGTPDTEQVKFVDITAENTDGERTLRVPFVVLRNKEFSTTHQNLAGLTVKGTHIQAIRSDDPRIYSYDKHWGVDPGIGTPGLPVTSVSGEITTVGTTGFVWDGTHYAVLSGPNPNGYSNVIAKFTSGGSFVAGSAQQEPQTLGAQGITWDGTNYWVASQQGIGVLDVVRKLGTNLYPVAGGFRVDSTIRPRGLTVLDSNLYLVDTTDNDVKVYDYSGNTNAAQSVLQFDLDDNNHDPRGIAYLDDYFYVIEAGQGAVNDSIFVYPDFKTWSDTVPEILSFELVRSGPFKTDDAVRVKVTFTGDVDVGVATRLQLRIGGNTRLAVPVASQSATSVITADVTDVNVVYFYYSIVADDTDADGITTPLFPFATAGSIQPHDDSLAEHSLISASSTFRAVAPGGVNALVPSPVTSVNSISQPDWAETDRTSRSFIRNKPTNLVGFPNSVSLGEFVWVRDDSDGIQYDVSGTRYTSLNVSQISSVQDWGPMKTFAKGQTILVRVPLAGVTKLPGIYADGLGYERDLSHIHTDTDNWHAFNRGSQHTDGYFYYALKAQTTESGGVYSAVRKIDASHITNLPSVAPQQQVDWDATSGVTSILNKPEIEFLERGTVTMQSATAGEVVAPSSANGRITPSAGLLAEARERGSQIHLTVTIPWRTKTDSATLADAEVSIADNAGGDLVLRNPDSDGSTEDIPKSTTTYTPYRLTLNIPYKWTHYTLDISIYNSDLNETLQFGTVAYELRLNRDLPLEGSASIDVEGGRISVADGGITDDMLDVDTFPKKLGFRDALDLEPFDEFSSVVTNQGTGQRRVDRTIPSHVVNAAIGARPFQVTVTGTLTARANATVEVSVKIIPGTRTGVVGAAAARDVTSTNGAEATWSLTGVVGPQYRDFFVLFERKSAAGFYDATLHATTTLGMRDNRVYVASTGFNGNLATTDDTLSKVLWKVDNLELSDTTHIPSADATITNFLTDAPQNQLAQTDKSIDFSVLESNTALGYAQYVLSFEGTGSGTRNGTASLYFLPTGETDEVGKRFYLFEDEPFGTPANLNTGTAKDFAGSVLVPLDKVDGTLKLRRTSGNGTGVLSFATADVNGVRLSPDSVPALHPVKQSWTPTLSASSGTMNSSSGSYWVSGNIVHYTGSTRWTPVSSTLVYSYNIALPYVPDSKLVDADFEAVINSSDSTVVSEDMRTLSSNRLAISVRFNRASTTARTFTFSGWYIINP